MTKRLLVTCDYMPHILEYMEPAINEARRRGYDIIGAYFGTPARDKMAAMGINKLYPFGGRWDKEENPPVLQVPQAFPLLDKLKLTAVFVDMTGAGHAGGAWVEYAYQRGITSLEFGGCRSRVYRFGKKAQNITDQYVAQLRKVGYGQHSDGLLVGTRAWRWVGLNVGDRLRKPLNKAEFKRSLGLNPKQKYVLLMGNWGVGEGYGRMTSIDLAEWDEMARANGMTLVYSPHPTFYYTKLPSHFIPKSVIVTSTFPARLWERKPKTVNTFDLVRASEFVIYQYRNNTMALCVAARKPMWLRRWAIGRGDPAQFSREPWDGEGKDVVRLGPGWPYADRIKKLFNYKLRMGACYRTAQELEQLFQGKLRFPGSEKERAGWDREWRLRLDGKTAERIVDLIDVKESCLRVKAETQPVCLWS